MDKRVIKFIALSILFIIIAYSSVLFKFNNFILIGLVDFISICYFVAKVLMSLWQLIKGLEVRTNLIIVAVGIIALASIFLSLIVILSSGNFPK